MGGKAAILMVLGFSLILLVTGNNFNRISGNAVDNVTDYYGETNAYNIASSAANIAANKIFMNQSWNTGFQNVSFSDGSMSVTVTSDSIKSTKTIHATGKYFDPVQQVNIEKTITVVLQPSKFSKFAYYSAYEPSNIWWTTGDTVWGPMHVQGYLRAYGDPVFMGKVTTQSGLILNDPGHWETVRVRVGRRWTYQNVWVPGADDPKFYGGFETGVDLPMPTDGVSNLHAAAQAGGVEFKNHDTVYIKFDSDSIKYKYSKSSNYTAALTSTLAPNGVIFATDAVVRLEGTVKGQYTLGVSGTHSKGKVFIDNDILLDSDPKTDPNSTDLFGIVAQNDVMITDNAANRNNVDIYASIYSEEGGFGADKYDTRPNSGFINLYGGISQSTRRAVGTFNSYGISTGFNKRYKYDDRLMIASPPYFPGTGAFQIVSWYE